MYIKIVDNTNTILVKLIKSKKNMKYLTGSHYKGVVYLSNSNKYIKGDLVNVLIVTNTKKKNSFIQFDHNSGILVDSDNKYPLGTRILDIIDYYKINKKINFINFSNFI